MRVRGRIRRPLATVGAALAVWLIVGRIHLMRLLRRPYSGMGRIADAGIEERIRRELLSWPGVTVAPHRYGGIEFRLGKRELGHLHGDYLADLPFPIRLREELVATRRAMPHHILPLSGWVSYPIRDADAIPGALALFRLAYARATAKRGGEAINAEDAERKECAERIREREREGSDEASKRIAAP